MGKHASLLYSLKSAVLSDDMPNTTAKIYRAGLTAFANWAKANGFNRMDKIQPHAAAIIQDYERALESRYSSPSTIHTRLAPVCKAFKVPMDSIEKPLRSVAAIEKGRSPDKGSRGRDELEDPRFRELVAFQQAVGIRRNELRKLKPESLTRDESGYLCIEVERGKGGKRQLQRILPQYEDTVKTVLKRYQTGEQLFKALVPASHLNLHAMRAEVAQTAYRHYESRIKHEGHDKLLQELKARYAASNERRRLSDPEKYKKCYERWTDDVVGHGGVYKLRGAARQLAIDKGLPTEYDRVALMAVSEFHLAHHRTDVAVEHYLTR